MLGNAKVTNIISAPSSSLLFNLNNFLAKKDNILIKNRLLFYDLGLIGIQEVLQKEKETKQIKCNVPCSAGG